MDYNGICMESLVSTQCVIYELLHSLVVSYFAYSLMPDPLAKEGLVL